MPTAPVDNKGTVLYYEDSGIPSSITDYVTLVLIHGTCFHSAVYRPMIPYAAEEKLRLVLLNMRGYPGSTPYSQDELELLGGDIEAQQAAQQARGVELATFLQWFIKTEKISPISEIPSSGKLVGGLSVLSWSGGNGTTLAMFAHADKVPGEARKLFDTYLRSFVLYDASSTAVGSPPPLGIKNVNVDGSAPVEDQAREFGYQVSSYYPPYTLPDTLDASCYPPRGAIQDQPGPLDPKYSPTTSKMSPDEFRSMTHPPILERTQHLIWSPRISATFGANLARALYDCRFDDGSGMMKKVWPALRVHAVWCDMTAGEAAWAAAVLHHGYKNAPPEGRRPLEMHKLEGANHFLHWEEPEMFVKFLAGII